MEASEYVQQGIALNDYYLLIHIVDTTYTRLAFGRRMIHGAILLSRVAAWPLAGTRSQGVPLSCKLGEQQVGITKLNEDIEIACFSWSFSIKEADHLRSRYHGLCSSYSIQKRSRRFKPWAQEFIDIKPQGAISLDSRSHTGRRATEVEQRFGRACVQDSILNCVSKYPSVAMPVSTVSPTRYTPCTAWTLPDWQRYQFRPSDIPLARAEDDHGRGYRTLALVETDEVGRFVLCDARTTQPACLSYALVLSFCNDLTFGNFNGDVKGKRRAVIAFQFDQETSKHAYFHLRAIERSILAHSPFFNPDNVPRAISQDLAGHPGSQSELSMTSRLFERATAQNVGPDGHYHTPYKVHDAIRSATSPYNPGWIANRAKTRISEIRASTVASMTDRGYPELSRGDRVWVSFNIYFHRGIDSWWTEYVPVDVIRIRQVVVVPGISPRNPDDTEASSGTSSSDVTESYFEDDHRHPIRPQGPANNTPSRDNGNGDSDPKRQRLMPALESST
ncbi:hypothetical protein DFP72DRAFT_856850 [Ephemerocybe angulata]|uniref:Uncharacterized protein n=1 Tax=Ephemerocybe angulata TaxID=980116 RepID=A0A8H6HFP4_9AGAR|nr:hypothetical protein DFP72DRAFT_856850 [Tulosesus angulatus]